jgi:diaminopimelate decarboxylase
VGEGDYLALLSAGAYGFAQASNYNTRPQAAEILVNGRRAAEARTRQPVKEIWSGEKIVAWLR